MEISGLKNKLSAQSKEKSPKTEYANVESNDANEEYAEPLIKNENNQAAIISDIKKEVYSTVNFDDTATVYENDDRTVYENDDRTVYANDSPISEYANDGFHDDYENVITPELESVEELDENSSYDIFSASQPTAIFAPSYQRIAQDSKKQDEAKQEAVSEHRVKPGCK
ncbi:MAG: hypothetical protein HYX61_11250 [Gammaproteobacteria bacterium]|nr:hypothetical protein [Gammaproteobacteria bacterium]